MKEGLPRIGFAVLLFDRRGTGDSSGDPSADYGKLAEDAVAGLQALGNLPRIDSRKIGFWGISQGGWIAILATDLARHAAFTVPVSAPLGTVERQMEFATSNLLKVRGYGENDVKDLEEARRAWLDYLRGWIPLVAASRIVSRVEIKPWFELAFIPKSGELDASRDALNEMEFDPTETIKQIKVPMFFIYGSGDPWVPVEESVKRLREIMIKSSNITFTVIPGANHEMMFKERELME